MNLLLFSLGASMGAPIRFWIDSQFRSKYQFPVGIFIVNIAGSFIIGLYAHHMNYLAVGFCGALTTWSTFIVDLFMGVQNRAYRSALLNLVASLVLGVFAFKLGFSLTNA